MKPSVAVLLAVYRPDEAILTQLLCSLDAQTYDNCHLLLLDDSEDETVTQRLESLVTAHMGHMPATVARNKRNLGVRETFARLTTMAQADLLAYCDQDDVWQPEKLSQLTVRMQDPKVTLAYCNMSVIDGEGRTTHQTLQGLLPHLIPQQGAGLASYFLHNNCVSGCCMLVRSQVAKAALPFPIAFVHDQWLALHAAAQGEIAYCPQPLVSYRLHGHNQVGIRPLKGAKDRESYVSHVLVSLEALLEAAQAIANPDLQTEVQRQRAALAARRAFLQGNRLSNFWAFWRASRGDPKRLCLELALGVLPRPAGRVVIAYVRRH